MSVMAMSCPEDTVFYHPSQPMALRFLPTLLLTELGRGDTDVPLGMSTIFGTVAGHECVHFQLSSAKRSFSNEG